MIQLSNLQFYPFAAVRELLDVSADNTVRIVVNGLVWRLLNKDNNATKIHQITVHSRFQFVDTKPFGYFIHY
jgi:hypothetical protein